MSGMVGQITKTGGTNAITGGTFVPPVIQLKYALPQALLLCSNVNCVLCFFISLIIVHCDQYRSLDRAIVTGCRHVCLSSVCLSVTHELWQNGTY